jgi:hypothetical protein
MSPFKDLKSAAGIPSPRPIDTELVRIGIYSGLLGGLSAAFGSWHTREKTPQNAALATQQGSRERPPQLNEMPDMS